MEDEGFQGASGRRDFERGSLCSRRPPALALRRERAGDGEASLRRRVEELGASEREVGESEEKPGGGSSSGVGCLATGETRPRYSPRSLSLSALF